MGAFERQVDGTACRRSRVEPSSSADAFSANRSESKRASEELKPVALVDLGSIRHRRRAS